MTEKTLPLEWEPMPTNPVTNVQELVHMPKVTDPKELTFVLDQFHLTMNKGRDYSEIVQVQRVQRPQNYIQYMERKNELEISNPAECKNERWLFHGTTPDAIHAIAHGGFDRSYAGSAVGTRFGRGCYFAKDAKYSDPYSDPDGEGLKRMYLARVLTGEFTKGDPSIITSPPKDMTKKHILYDSVVNDVKDPVIFVVFKDDRAYPAYLITYKGF